MKDPKKIINDPKKIINCIICKKPIIPFNNSFYHPECVIIGLKDEKQKKHKTKNKIEIDFENPFIIKVFRDEENTCVYI